MWFGRRGKKRLSIAKQAAHLKRLFPDSAVALSQNSMLIWKGHLQPTPLSEKYHIQIKYRIGMRPEVRVLDPPLKHYEEQPIPHVFARERLCLFMYSYKEWSPEMIIAETIIPWTSLWLFYYEIWLSTGIWCGGGEHPPEGEPELKEVLGEKLS